LHPYPWHRLIEGCGFWVAAGGVVMPVALPALLIGDSGMGLAVGLLYGD